MKKVTAYMDDQGKIHASKLLCEQSNAFSNAIALVEDNMFHEMGADDIVNMIQNDKTSRDVFRKLIETSGRLEDLSRSHSAVTTEFIEQENESGDPESEVVNDEAAA